MLSPGDDLLEFHQAVVSTLRDAEEASVPLDPAPLPPLQVNMANPLLTHTSEDMARLEIQGDLANEQNDDESDNGKIPFQHQLLKTNQKEKSLVTTAKNTRKKELKQKYNLKN